jgi:hypothetical protein
MDHGGNQVVRRSVGLWWKVVQDLFKVQAKLHVKLFMHMWNVFVTITMYKAKYT